MANPRIAGNGTTNPKIKISQKYGQIIPTPRGSILHPSIEPPNATNMFVQGLGPFRIIPCPAIGVAYFPTKVLATSSLAYGRAQHGESQGVHHDGLGNAQLVHHDGRPGELWPTHQGLHGLGHEKLVHHGLGNVHHGLGDAHQGLPHGLGHEKLVNHGLGDAQLAGCRQNVACRVPGKMPGKWRVPAKWRADPELA